jgi:membrane fusion protein (multidrug efflux system)
LEELKGYFLKASPVLLLILGYFAYQNWTLVYTDDARVTGEVIPITARISGIIDKVVVVEHQEMKQGDTIAKFDDRSYVKALELAEAEVSSAQAKLYEADLNHSKAKKLLKRKVITLESFSEIKATLDQANTNLAVAKEKEVQAKINMESTKLTAPEDGRMAKNYIDEGAFASVGQTLFGFTTSATRWVIGNFSVEQLSKIKPGAIAKVRVDGFGGNSYAGTVETIVKRNTAIFANYPPESSGVNLTKNSSRTIVKVRLVNLSNEDKNLLQDGLPATISINVR